MNAMSERLSPEDGGEYKKPKVVDSQGGVDRGRRRFLRDAVLIGGGAVLGATGLKAVQRWIDVDTEDGVNINVGGEGNPDRVFTRRDVLGGNLSTDKPSPNDNLPDADATTGQVEQGNPDQPSSSEPLATPDQIKPPTSIPDETDFSNLETAKIGESVNLNNVVIDRVVRFTVDIPVGESVTEVGMIRLQDNSSVQYVALMNSDCIFEEMENILDGAFAIDERTTSQLAFQVFQLDEPIPLNELNTEVEKIGENRKRILTLRAYKSNNEANTTLCETGIVDGLTNELYENALLADNNDFIWQPEEDS